MYLAILLDLAIWLDSGLWLDLAFWAVADLFVHKVAAQQLEHCDARYLKVNLNLISNLTLLLCSVLVNFLWDLTLSFIVFL